MDHQLPSLDAYRDRIRNLDERVARWKEAGEDPEEERILAREKAQLTAEIDKISEGAAFLDLPRRTVNVRRLFFDAKKPLAAGRGAWFETEGDVKFVVVESVDRSRATIRILPHPTHGAYTMQTVSDRLHDAIGASVAHNLDLQRRGIQLTDADFDSVAEFQRELDALDAKIAELSELT